MSLKYFIEASERLESLVRKIQSQGYVRIMEAHSGLSALIVENIKLNRDGDVLQFDGIWESSLTDSASKGLPDAEVVTQDSRIETISQIMFVTKKPIIVDGDTGGAPVQFEYFVRKLEKMGVSAVIIEDKVFPKRNSLDTNARQQLEDPYVFSHKLKRGIAIKRNPNFLIIARIESLIAGLDIKDALKRAEIYIDSGADGIMIHSKKDEPDDILKFAHEFNKRFRSNLKEKPYLVCVPTTYNTIRDDELASYGFNIIIHANHMLRASYKAMKDVAETILKFDRGFEAEALCAPVKEIFHIVGFMDVKKKDEEIFIQQRLPVIIPAAGKNKVDSNLPISLVTINNKKLIEYQFSEFRKIGLKKFIIIKGFKGEKFEMLEKDENIIFLDNPEYEVKGLLYSLMRADKFMLQGFLMVYGDTLITADNLKKLFSRKEDIVLLIDKSYMFNKNRVYKKLDLVITKSESPNPIKLRNLVPFKLVEILKIGKEIDMNTASHEFIGVAYFSERGAEILRKVSSEFLKHKSTEKVSFTDVIQEIINRGFKVYGMEVFQGWMEVHSKEDLEVLERELKTML